MRPADVFARRSGGTWLNASRIDLASGTPAAKFRRESGPQAAFQNGHRLPVIARRIQPCEQVLDLMREVRPILELIAIGHVKAL